MTNSKEFKWRPEHFPAGTVVTVSCFNRTDGVLVSDFRDSNSADVTVQSISPNGVDSWVLHTGEMNTKMDMEFGCNLDHVIKIVKRADGPVKFKYYMFNDAMPNLKKGISTKLLNKNRFYFYSSHEIIMYLIKQNEATKQLYIKGEFFEFIMGQSFIKKETKGFVTLYSVDKKKIKRFIRQNINRWIQPMKEIRLADEISQREEHERYCRDLDDQFDRDYPPLDTGLMEPGDDPAILVETNMDVAYLYNLKNKDY